MQVTFMSSSVSISLYSKLEIYRKFIYNKLEIYRKFTVIFWRAILEKKYLIYKFLTIFIVKKYMVLL